MLQSIAPYPGHRDNTGVSELSHTEKRRHEDGEGVKQGDIEGVKREK